ncbi:MAG: hypothetical protein PF483_04035 [Halothiobacillus sp.]|nr:hypothetical protein [Halothiobacillus sp.]
MITELAEFCGAGPAARALRRLLADLYEQIVGDTGTPRGRRLYHPMHR